MNNKISIKILFLAMLICLFVASCKENKPKGDEFCWSPDGNKLAMINVESQELLIVDIEDDCIENITPIDNYSGEKAKIYAPTWSTDGQFLLYTKSNKESLDIFVYSLPGKKHTHIDNFQIPEQENLQGNAFPSWSPTLNEILWVTWNNLASHQIFSCLPDGKNKKLLIKVIGEKVFPSWSPDGKWIAYSVLTQEGNKNNGLWKMKRDGSNRNLIYNAHNISKFKWSPDGTMLAVVDENKGKTDLKYGLKIIDSDGNEKQIITWEKFEIIKLDWSPDGQKIAYVIEKNDVKNIWMVDLASQKKVKLTFDNLKDYFGWAGANQLFYSIKYPEEMITETKEEKETREVLEAVRGIKKENILMSVDKFKPLKSKENIFSFTFCRQHFVMAYFKPFEPYFLSSEIYFPVIEFADGNKLYPARTKAEHVAAADELYLNRKYDRALQHLSYYWNVDLNSADFRLNFDFDSIIEKMNADSDSSLYDMMLEGLNEGTLLKTVIIMRKLNQTEKADWLWEQFKKSTLYIVNNAENKQPILDENFWSTIGAYSRYYESDSGIKDLAVFLADENLDSVFITCTNFAQSMLAFESQQYELGLEKIKATIRYLPEELAELDDIRGLLSLHLMNSQAENEPVIISALLQLINRFPKDEDVFKIYEMLGDIYLKNGQQEKALEAYQSAVVSHFDNHEIWDKILRIR